MRTAVGLWKLTRGGMPDGGLPAAGRRATAVVNLGGLDGAHRLRHDFFALRFAATVAETGIGRQLGAASTEFRHDREAQGPH